MCISLKIAEWCIPFWVTLTLTLTSHLISRFFVSNPLYEITKPQVCLMLDQFCIRHDTVTFLFLILLQTITIKIVSLHELKMPIECIFALLVPNNA